jgi:hypothetical protein
MTKDSMTKDRVAQLPLYWKLIELLLQLYVCSDCVAKTNSTRQAAQSVSRP